MLCKRIIPCLDVKEGRTVKGVNFKNLSDAGDPVELALKYALQGADELVFLDITAGIEKRKIMRDLVKKVSEKLNIPFTVGGGISTVKDVSDLLESGADKVSVNSAAIRNPELIEELSNEFGVQCIVGAVDVAKINDEWIVMADSGKTRTDLKALNWVCELQERGAGEILLTSTGRDGTKQGFDFDLVSQVSEELNIPVIASGGAGSVEDFSTLFSSSEVTGALAASVFHYNTVQIPDLKTYLKNRGINVRL